MSNKLLYFQYTTFMCCVKFFLPGKELTKLLPSIKYIEKIP